MLPSATALGIPLQDPSAASFLKHVFGVPSTFLNQQPYFLGTSDDLESPMIFLKNAYRCLNINLDRDISLSARILDSGLLSHMRHLLLSLSQTLQLWILPSCTEAASGIRNVSSCGGCLSSEVLAQDYFELILHILSLFRKILPRFILGAKSYKDPIMLGSLLNIIPYSAKSTLTCQDRSTANIYVQVTSEILRIFSTWFKQSGFVEDVFLPKVIEALGGLPEERFGGLYLLLASSLLLSLRENSANDALQKGLLSNKVTTEKVQEVEEKEKKNEEMTNKKGGEKVEEVKEEDNNLMNILMKKHEDILGFILNKIYESQDAIFAATGIAMLKMFANTFPQSFAIRLAEELASSIKGNMSIPFRSSESDLSGTPTARVNNKWAGTLSKKLIVLRELIPTMCKYAILRSSLPEDLNGVLRGIGAEVIGIKSERSEDLECLLIQNLQLLCTIDEPLCLGRSALQYVPYELLPPVSQLQKILNCLSQHLILDPPTFNSLTNDGSKASLIILNYLKAVQTFAGNIIGRSIILFGDHYATLPQIAKPTICFKELIDQCNELLKLGAHLDYLSPIICEVLDITLTLTKQYDNNGIFPVGNGSEDNSKVSHSIIKGIIGILIGDINGIAKLQERFKPFYAGNEAVASKWRLIDKLIQRLSQKDNTQENPLEIHKPRSLEAIYNSYKDKAEKTLSGKIISHLKSIGIKKAEILYSIKQNEQRNTLPRKSYSLMADIVQLSNFEKHQSDWLVERLYILEENVVAYLADVKFSVGFLLPKIIEDFNKFSDPEQLQLEHANLFLSIQIMKRKQKEETERRKKGRLKPLAQVNKLAQFSTVGAGLAARKPISSVPSRSISTHVDDYEKLDKSSHNPFPSQFNKGMKKPGTPPPTIPTSSASAPTIINTPTERNDPLKNPNLSSIGPSVMPFIQNISSHKPSPAPIEGKPQEPNKKIQDILELMSKIPKKVETPKQTSGHTPVNVPHISQPFNVPIIPSPSPFQVNAPPVSQPQEQLTQSNFQNLASMLHIRPEDIMSILAKGGSIGEATPQEAKPLPNIRPPVPISPAMPASPHGLPTFTQQEMEAFREVQNLKQQYPNDPRAQERIRRLLEQYPNIVPSMKKLLK